ncbi:MAG TPA: hypothetical protein VE646_05155 [Actinomycetota bacterium]|jgi:hypothetical protein|nr:hypothetical protein [Actinomycetota bacterium]
MPDDETLPVGALEEEKQDPATSPSRPQPSEAEVESARLLANDARPTLQKEGMSYDTIRRLADEFIARDLGEGLPEFLDWARARTQPEERPSD